MKRFLVLALAAVFVAPASAAVKANPATFTDATGDAGTAADVSSVVVSNDANGQITFQVNFADPLASTDTVDLYVDADNNASTGDPNAAGAEYDLYADIGGNSWDLSVWNGSSWVDASSYATVHAGHTTSRQTFSINASELGGTSAFNFWVDSNDGSGGQGHEDQAPDNSVWSYQLAAPSGGTTTHAITDAPMLPTSAHYTGKSIKQTRLSSASYSLSKDLGIPKSIAVACWDVPDWQAISGDTSDSYYSTLGLYLPSMPHWIHLSPDVCRGMETLLYHRPQYPNRIIAGDLDTVTHEMVHALGITDEARTECYAMQLSIIMALELHVPAAYSAELARLTIQNYSSHPPRYIDRSRCHEDGAWDLFPHRPSPPWHNFAGV